MNTTDSDYAQQPTAFRSMREAPHLTDTLEEIIHDQRIWAANVRPELVEIFSEIVNNGAEHGMSDQGAHAHVRYIPNRRGYAVIADPGPGIRAAPAYNTQRPQPKTD